MANVIKRGFYPVGMSEIEGNYVEVNADHNEWRVWDAEPTPEEIEGATWIFAEFGAAMTNLKALRGMISDSEDVHRILELIQGRIDSYTESVPDDMPEKAAWLGELYTLQTMICAMAGLLEETM